MQNAYRVAGLCTTRIASKLVYIQIHFNNFVAWPTSSLNVYKTEKLNNLLADTLALSDVLSHWLLIVFISLNISLTCIILTFNHSRALFIILIVCDSPWIFPDYSFSMSSAPFSHVSLATSGTLKATLAKTKYSLHWPYILLVLLLMLFLYYFQAFLPFPASLCLYLASCFFS